MEEKTTTNNTNNQFANLSSPFEEPSRSPLELEQASAETQANEPFWFKVLCFLGGFYPIVRENGKCNCNWKTVCWSIFPLVWTVYFLLGIIFGFDIFTKILFTLLLILQLSLSYTRKPFSDAVVGEENRLYMNTVAKRGVVGGVVCLP